MRQAERAVNLAAKLHVHVPPYFPSIKIETYPVASFTNTFSVKSFCTDADLKTLTPTKNKCGIRKLTILPSLQGKRHDRHISQTC